jgi:hypothetical protein
MKSVPEANECNKMIPFIQCSETDWSKYTADLNKISRAAVTGSFSVRKILFAFN